MQESQVLRVKQARIQRDEFGKIKSIENNICCELEDGSFFLIDIDNVNLSEAEFYVYVGDSIVRVCSRDFSKPQELVLSHGQPSTSSKQLYSSEPLYTSPEPLCTSPEPLNTSPEPFCTSPELLNTSPEPLNTAPEQQRKELFRWNDAATKLFLDEYKQNYALFKRRSIKTMKNVWLKVADVMRGKGYVITATQAQNKFKSLDRQFKNYVTNRKKTGQGKVTCPYEKELTDIFAPRHNIIPVVLSGCTGTVRRQDVLEKINIQDNREETVVSPANSDSTLIETHNTHKPTREGKTSTALKQCQAAINKLAQNIESRNEKLMKVQEDMVDKYNQLIEIQKKALEDAAEQRREKNELLKQLLEVLKNK